MEAKKFKCACGAVVNPPEGARTFVCKKCGIKHKNPLFKPEEASPDNLTACKKCGAVFHAEAKSCPECGAFRSAEKKSPDENPAGGKVIKLVLMGLLGVGLIVVAIIGMTRESNEKETREVEPSGPIYDVVTMPRQVERRTTLIGVQNAIQSFEALEGRLPRNLDELAEVGFTPPPPPDGMEYHYNPDTGEVSLVEADSGQD